MKLKGVKFTKYLKYTILAFAISCMFSALTSFAYNNGYQSIVGITLPTWGNEVAAYTHDKERESYQYYYSGGAVDNLTSATVNIKARTKSSDNIYSSYITVSKNETKTWGDSVNMFAGDTYTLLLRREKSAISTASHSGGWYIDDRLK